MFPEVYVENIHSKRYVCLENETYTMIKDHVLPGLCREVYGLIPYEEVLKYIDLVEARATSTFLILKPEPGEDFVGGFMVDKGSKLCLQEIVGNYIYFSLREGSRVKIGDTIAYIVTNKLEIRNIKSICKGLVVLVVDMPWEEPRKAIMVVSNDCRSINVRKSARSSI